ncbi:hypothetical protein ACOSP7_012160 [Xanthoceras sorbifolium]
MWTHNHSSPDHPQTSQYISNHNHSSPDHQAVDEVDRAPLRMHQPPVVVSQMLVCALQPPGFYSSFHCTNLDEIPSTPDNGTEPIEPPCCSLPQFLYITPPPFLPSVPNTVFI